MYNNETDQETSEFTTDNQEHLLRLKDDYLKTIAKHDYVKDWVETIMFNSFNIAITLYLINLGMGLIVASMAGFSVGAYPGVKSFTDTFNYNQGEGMNINGKLIQGVFRIISAGLLTFFIGSPWQNLEKMAKFASDFYNQDVATYEYSQKPESVSFETRFFITLGVGAMAGVILINLLKKSDD